MKTKTVWKAFLCLFLFTSAGQAQTVTTLKELRVTSPVPIRKPILLDSINIKGEVYSPNKALESEMLLPSFENLPQTIQATDTLGTFLLPKAEKDYTLQLLSFRVQSDYYTNQLIKIVSPSIFECYIDGKKYNTKGMFQDSIQVAHDFMAEINVQPSTFKDITIKYLSDASKEGDEQIRITMWDKEITDKEPLTASIDPQRPITMRDMVEGDRLSGAKISPNGRFVLITGYSILPGGEGSSYTELYDSKTGKRTYLGGIFPKWMPKTNAYTYTIPVDGHYELIKVNPETNETSVLIKNLPSGACEPLPDESSLLFFDYESGDNRQGDLKALASPNDRMQGFYSKYYLSTYDLKSGIKNRLTYGKESAYLQNVSPDSKTILVGNSTETITEHPFSKNSLYQINLETLEVDTIWSNQKFVHSAQYSPQGNQLLITGAPDAFDGIGLNIKEGQIANSYDIQLFIMDLKTKEVKPITKDFAPSVKNAQWNPLDQLIYINTTDEDFENVYVYNPKKESFTKLDLNEEAISHFELSADGSKAVYIGASTYNPSRAYLYDIKKGKSELIADPYGERLAQIKLGEVKDWSFEASDGTTIKGQYYLPTNFDPNKKYPMIVYYYGGTAPTTRGFDHPYSMHVYASLGYVVYVLQPSGTIGFGQEFSARHVNAWGKRTAEDIIEGTKKFCSDHPFINKDKIGCIGASYGGFMTQYLQTQTDIFATAISHAGISSIASYWGEGYWGFSYGSAASAHSYPWNNKEMYVNQSPLFNADKMNTPLLLLHGTVDTNVPIGESIQMFAALKILGKPVEFVQVKDENHGIQNYHRKMQWNNTIYSWFALWLKDDASWWNALYPNRKY